MNYRRIIPLQELPSWLYAELWSLGVRGSHIEAGLFSVYHSAVKQIGIYKIIQGLRIGGYLEGGIFDGDPDFYATGESVAWKELSAKAQKWLTKHVLRKKYAEYAYFPL